MYLTLSIDFIIQKSIFKGVLVDSQDTVKCQIPQYFLNTEYRDEKCHTAQYYITLDTRICKT